MANIVPKLNLNRTPNLSENYSLIFAKNTRLDVDGTIHKDYGIKSIGSSDDTIYSTIFYKCIADLQKYLLNDDNKNTLKYNWYDKFYNDLKNHVNYDDIYIENYEHSEKIVGIISYNKEVYIFVYGVKTENNISTNFSAILLYNEKDDTIYPIDCNWNYSGGTIVGNVITNLVGDKIINIGESFDDKTTSTIVPFKSINIDKCSHDDDESIYTMMPNIPITNINVTGNFCYVIPNGVYQFFVRYKVRDNFYTNWFPASKECFAGNSNVAITNFGTLGYCNTHTDSEESFVFTIEHLYSEYYKNYEGFQIGFILSHDDTQYARAWKVFNFDKTVINFDYKAEDAEEIEITDLLNVGYQLYNVGNITSFKNKLYISNYNETEFNENLKNSANNIRIYIGEKISNQSYGNYTYSSINNGDKIYITSLTANGVTTKIGEENGVIHKLLTSPDNKNNTIWGSINNAIDNKSIPSSINKINQYSCIAYGNLQSLENAQVSAKNKLIKTYSAIKVNFESDTVQKITINDKTVANFGNINNVLSWMYNKVSFLSSDGVFTDADRNVIYSFTIKLYRTCEYSYYTTSPTGSQFQTGSDYEQGIGSLSIENGEGIDNLQIGTIQQGTTTQISTTYSYEQTLTFSIRGQKNLFSSNNVDELKKISTLIPYQKYKFYIHFIKQNGEITNGYLCDNIDGNGNVELECYYKDTCNSAIYPIFSNINIPENYAGCFFSIIHSSVISSTIANIELRDVFEGSCMDFNTGRVSIPKNILIKSKDIWNSDQTTNGIYYSSADASIPRYFGCDGIVKVSSDSGSGSVSSGRLAYAITDYSSQQDEYATLTKCTPYIIKGTSEYNDCNSLNLLGFVCSVYFLDRERCVENYSDGSSVYAKNEFSVDESVETNDLYIGLKERGKYLDSTYPLSSFGLYATGNTKIYSNYNYNYLSLVDDPKISIKTIYNSNAEDFNPDSNQEGNQIIYRLLTSLTISSIYELRSMYHTYPKKTYSVYTKNSKNRFDNTIRSSALTGDESEISIFTFNADDYYNTPTNKGIIVNLVSVGDAILVHTEDSMFKFNGTPTISSTTGEIQQTEASPFEVGISEIFGSDFGFAGIQNRRDHIITENGYIFFDRDSKIIYLYSGNNQIVRLSDSIEKLFNRKEIKNIAFANDYYNNRFFVSIQFSDNYYATLSYSFINNAKSFVSLHDFTFNYSFNTKTNCYFCDFSYKNIYTIDKKNLCQYNGLYISYDSLYPSNSINFNKSVYVDNKISANLTFRCYDSFVDVIVNENYEIIKTLNSISWCGRQIVDEFPLHGTQLNLADIRESSIPCAKLKIYTDTCVSNDIDCTQSSNEKSIFSADSYKYPRFNQGKWNINYFRDISNVEDIDNYLTRYEDGRNSAQLRSDNNALIEGRYFVVRFIFNNNFKLETLSLNYKNKI